MAVCTVPLEAQNPVRELKADVKANRFVNLSWQAPVADAARAPQEKGDFSLWKEVAFGSEFNSVRQIDDFYLCAGNMGDNLYIKKLDMDMQETDSIPFPYNKYGSATSFMTVVGDDIYALRQARVFIDSIFKFTVEHPEPEFVIQSKFKSGIKGLAYVSELDGGKGGFVEAGVDSVCFYDMTGNILEGHKLNLKDIPLADGGKLGLKGIAYYNGSYYVAGCNGEKKERILIPFVWEFDSEGNYVAQRVDTRDQIGFYFDCTHMYISKDSETGNVYLVMEARENDMSGYYTNLYYYEVETNSSVKGYEVYRDGSMISPDGYRATVFADTLTEAGTYRYEVRAVYEAGMSGFEGVDVVIEEVGDCVPPVNVVSRVVNRNNVVVQWERPVMDGAFAASYLVFRDGKQIGSTEVPVWIDVPGADGEYKYTVKAVYDNSGVSPDSEVAVAELTGLIEQHEPRNLQALSFIDEDSRGCVSLKWDVPLFGDEIVIGYSDMEASGTVSEWAKGMGVKYKAGTLDCMENYVIDSVSFVAGCPGVYRILIYENGTTVYDDVLDSLSVKFDALNTVPVSVPVLIKKGKEYLVGVVARPDAGSVAEGRKCVTADSSLSVHESNFTAISGFSDASKGYYYDFFMKTGQEKGNYNIRAHFKATNNVYIDEEECNFKGYAIYRNGEKLQDAVAEGREYTDTDVPDGNHTYTVASVWEDGSELHSNEVGKNVCTLYGAPDNLAAGQKDGVVSLSWNKPLTGAPFVKRWDSGKNVSKLGDKSGNTLYMATLYTTEDLKSFGGFSVTHIEFFPAEYATFTLFVYSGRDLVYEQQLGDDEVKLGEFNLVELKNPVVIDPGKDLRVGYKAEDYPLDFRPCGVDESLSKDGKGNQLSMNGKNWSSASEQGIENNWNIAFTIQFINNAGIDGNKILSLKESMEIGVAEEDNVSLALTRKDVCPGMTSKLGNNELVGYNIYRNGDKLNADPISEQIYSDTVKENATFEYQVSAVYSETDEMYSNIVEIDCVSSIEETNAGNTVRYDRSSETIIIEGEFDRVVVINSTGAVVKDIRNGENRIEADTLALGVYVVIVENKSELRQYKLNI